MAPRITALLDALTWPHGTSGYRDTLTPGRSLGEVRAEVVSVRRQTADTVTLGLRADRRWAGFRAGQHVQVTVEVDGTRHTRCFSLAGSAREGGRRLELTVKAHPTSTVSRHLREHARPGTVVGLSQSAGDFTLPAAPPVERPVLLLSGGSGVTPVLSMLRTLCADGHTGPVVYVHHARSAADVLYRDEALALAAAHPNVTVDLVPEDERGRFSVAGLAATCPRWTEAETYLCGPMGFMDAVTDAFESAGALERLHVERFTLAPAAAGTAPSGGAVRFAGSGITVDDDGRTLLEQAEAAGLSPLHGCRMGICATCTRHLEAGCVTDIRTGAVTAEPGTPVRICVSAPAGDVTIDL